MHHLKLLVSGMNCAGCANSVTTILSRNLSVDKDVIEVNLEGGTAIVKTDEPINVDPDALAEALFELKSQGFPAQQV